MDKNYTSMCPEIEEGCTKILNIIFKKKRQKRGKTQYLMHFWVCVLNGVDCQVVAHFISHWCELSTKTERETKHCHYFALNQKYYFRLEMQLC